MKRQKNEIWHCILRIALDPSIKTKIVYGANLNFKTIEPHLEALLGKEFLSYDGKFYRTTEKGKEYIKVFEEMKSVLLVVA